MSKKTLFYIFLIASSALLFSGCAALLPHDSEIKKSKWNSYDEAMGAFDQIALGQTTFEQLKTLGFDPRRTPNIKVLTFLDVKKQFITSTFDKAEYLPKGVQECIESMDACGGLELNIIRNDNRRYGNAFLDVFNFKRETEQSGWEFIGLVVMKHDIVVYKLASGRPLIAGDKKQVNPLGPLQSLDGSIFLRGAQ